MNINKFNKKGLIGILILILMIMPFNIWQKQTITTNDNDTNRLSKKNFSNRNLNLNDISIEPWWNNSFQYRRIINITNPYSYALTDYLTYIQFDYTSLVSEGKINANLSDVRIVEKGVVRDYYIQKDHPSNGIATIWFYTNISAGPNTLERDVFMYYGNSSINFDPNHHLAKNPAGEAWWRFEDAPGSATLTDSIGAHTGYPRHGLSSANWVTGKLGDYAIQFNNYEYIALNMSFPVGTVLDAFTVTAWVKVPDRKGDWSILDFDRSEYFTVSVGYEGYSATDDVVEFDTTSQTGAINDMVSDITSGDVCDGTWHHIAVVFNSSQVYDKKIYIDGQLVKWIDAYPTGVGIGSNRYDRWGFIGDGSEATTFDGGRNSRYYTGTADEIRYFGYALSDKQIEHIYNYTQDLSTALDAEQAREAIIKVTAVDVHGNYIPYVNISIYDYSKSNTPIASKIANSEGYALFTGLDLTPVEYNFTVTMESSVINGLVKTINVTSKAILFTQLYTEINLTCKVNTHIFQITDIDGNPVESGWVLVGNETTGYGKIQNCSINSNGIARFWWLNTSPSYKYNYTIFYRNDLYTPNVIKLKSGQITDFNQINIPISVNLTTVNFTCYDKSNPLNPIEGVKLRFYTENNVHIVDLTTDENGNAQLRWWNSSGPNVNGNYTLKVFFWEDRQFNMTDFWLFTNPNDVAWEINFTVKNKASYKIYVLANPGDYQTKLISLNPTSSIAVKWGANVLLRTLFNITKNPSGSIGPSYADTVSYKIKEGGTELFSEILPKDPDYIGRHQGYIELPH
ncbi:MAG: LamG-like jellyroll fold domain-containing protein [Candidatus Helarchaeota archaeon]